LIFGAFSSLLFFSSRYLDDKTSVSFSSVFIGDVDIEQTIAVSHFDYCLLILLYFAKRTNYQRYIMTCGDLNGAISLEMMRHGFKGREKSNEK